MSSSSWEHALRNTSAHSVNTKVAFQTQMRAAPSITCTLLVAAAHAHAVATRVWPLGSGCIRGLADAQPPIVFDPSPYASRLGIWTLPPPLLPDGRLPVDPAAPVTAVTVDLCAPGETPPGSPGFYVGAACVAPILSELATGRGSSGPPAAVIGCGC